jgi:DNA-directed RNA polymerase subunit RPC12/RpoP
MQILNQSRALSAGAGLSQARQPGLWPERPGGRSAESERSRLKAAWRLLILGVAAAALAMTACKKDAASDAIDTDANGYLCLKCGVKLYTARSVFIGPQCPKCQQESLMDVVGYYCEKDHHLTIRPRRGDRQPLACEQCQGPLVNAMRSPREKDLKAWGATKASS